MRQCPPGGPTAAPTIKSRLLAALLPLTLSACPSDPSDLGPGQEPLVPVIPTGTGVDSSQTGDQGDEQPTQGADATTDVETSGTTMSAEASGESGHSGDSEGTTTGDEELEETGDPSEGSSGDPLHCGLDLPPECWDQTVDTPGCPFDPCHPDGTCELSECYTCTNPVPPQVGFCHPIQ